MGKKGALQPPGGTGRTKEVLMADTELQGMLGAVTLDIDYHGQLLWKLQHKWWSERLETEAEAEQRAAKFIACLGEEEEDTMFVLGHSCMHGAQALRLGDGKPGDEGDRWWVVRAAPNNVLATYLFHTDDASSKLRLVKSMKLKFGGYVPAESLGNLWSISVTRKALRTWRSGRQRKRRRQRKRTARSWSTRPVETRTVGSGHGNAKMFNTVGNDG